jgi:hypothetical protein
MSEFRNKFNEELFIHVFSLRNKLNWFGAGANARAKFGSLRLSEALEFLYHQRI